MTPEQKKWIDESDVETLLRKWRFAPSGDPLLQGECGEYYKQKMMALQSADPVAWTRASKNIGW